ncbi:hypothetical protein ASPACDRAFT_1877381 [Aspergillus aculeatus ATCC 16872]|uniref:Beta-xylosidase C-terminal Concanavalin A-like domain-containing protein n=1 Tax=Aspergillus aculeatus (strain ATCC 16872 / CBS 172.66 / WB 5094) TaxID=690307 RepID=A0A1L9WEZ8_ASPA1|nr:uncharacterized protein ASPACDRAFT_1877381 [Aspergillus aculeatus ATCC 16872]OJJ94756.1 hypothetical protein ASPACDRAFT_1877381 [Aspergillus aculeatus ATCC 16872]
MQFLLYLVNALLIPLVTATRQTNYTNPILPGWHSDPSCAFIAAWDETFFCTTSTFLAFPGIPIYASKDLIHWKLVSYALSRPSQAPFLLNATSQSEGIYASTLRFHKGTLYLTTALISSTAPNGSEFLVFTTTDPYADAAWSDPITITTTLTGYDPDLFWDAADNDRLYLTIAGYNHSATPLIFQSPVALPDWTATSWSYLWNGTENIWPEGPHLYRKDKWYYLLIAEGGTGTSHQVSIARSKHVTGPYEPCPANPILTNKNTTEYFQTVGHADLFQDSTGNWWGVALATRSGPAWEIYPMGRETVLYPAQWEEGAWPQLQPVRGRMRGPLPPSSRAVQGQGPFVDASEKLSFAPGSPLPPTLQTWRPQPHAQDQSLFTISPPDHPHTLRLTPSWANLTGNASFTPGKDDLSFLGRIQTSTLFEYAVTLRDFTPSIEAEEAGVSIFLTQTQHVDLGVVLLRDAHGKLALHFRLRVEASGRPDLVAPDAVVTAVPVAWYGRGIVLRVRARDDAGYVLSAALVGSPGSEIVLGRASAGVLSGGSGPFTGTLLGVYATGNGGPGETPSYWSDWTYVPVAQEIDAGVFVDA